MSERRKDPAASRFGRIGGLASAKKLTPAQRHARARHAVQARWARRAKKESAT